MSGDLKPCPFCGEKAERHAIGPFMTGSKYPEWRNVIRCKNHCTRGAIKDSWRDADRDWNNRFSKESKS